MESVPNYEEYSLDELLDAKKQIDANEFPERLKTIELAISSKQEKLNDDIETSPEAVSKPEKSNEAWGFGGWLLLLGFGIVISPFKLLIDIWSLYVPLFSDGTIEDILDNAPISFAFIFFSEILLNVVKFFMSIFLITLFFRKMHTFPKWYFINWAFVASLSLLQLGLMSLLYPTLVEIDEGMTRTLIAFVIALCVWTPYLYKSERANKTFIHGRK